MYGNDRRWPAAALAGGLAALTALAGCGSYTSAGRSAARGGMDPLSEMTMGEKNPAGGAAAVTAPSTVSPGQPARTLTSDPLDAPAASSVLDARRSAEMAAEMSGGMSGHGGHEGHEGHEGHGGGTYRQLDAGRGPGADEESGKEHLHTHAAGAVPEEAAVYACPMHPAVTATAPGKCSKCGMTLVKRRKG